MNALPVPLARFAATHLGSLEDLKVLALWVVYGERCHAARASARTLGWRRGPARAALDHLARNNLLDIRITGDLRYRFRPGTSELESQALALVDAYRRNPSQASDAIGG